MKSFLKYTLATMLGLFLFSILGFLILIGIASVAGSSQSIEIKDNSVLKIDLNIPIREREEENPLEGLPIPGSESAALGLYELKESIRLAIKDEKIKGIFLQGGFSKSGWASNEELREVLKEFRKSGKFIYSYGEVFSEGAYFTASVADSLFLNPEGLIELNGLSSEITFLKGMLDKLEIKPEVFRVGEFKSAVEPFLRENMSEANRLQATSFMNSLNSHLISRIAESKKLPLETVKIISDSMKIRSAGDAATLGLIHRTAYYDEVISSLRKKLKLSKEEEVSFVSIKKYAKAKREEIPDEISSNKIAVIIAQGEINSGKGSAETIGSEQICEALETARKDKKVKAVVLRINSPGGSALASDVMWREIQLTRKEKPVIASMSDVAASGGYYMAMGCDQIVAQPNTITGSIGVFGLMFNTQDMFKNKLGITFDGVKTGVFSDVGNMTRPLSDLERSLIQKEVDEIYETFTRKASEGRKMPLEKLKNLAGGRVWSGTEALQNGLVDQLGGMDKALEIAAAKAKIGKDYRIRILPAKKNLVEEILEGLGQEAKLRMLQAELGDLYPLVTKARQIQTWKGIQARLPFDWKIQ
jgi:protease-4